MGSHKSVILGSGVPSGGSGPAATQLPATLGPKTSANSLSVVLASDINWTNYRSSALEASAIIKASSGLVRAVSVRLDETAPTNTYFVQLLNSASLPADGAVTVIDCQKRKHITGTDDNLVFDFGDNCVVFSSGLVVVLSTTEFTKTISSAYLSMSVQYK